MAPAQSLLITILLWESSNPSTPLYNYWLYLILVTCQCYLLIAWELLTKSSNRICQESCFLSSASSYVVYSRTLYPGASQYIATMVHHDVLSHTFLVFLVGEHILKVEKVGTFYFVQHPVKTFCGISHLFYNSFHGKHTVIPIICEGPMCLSNSIFVFLLKSESAPLFCLILSDRQFISSLVFFLTNKAIF